MAALPPVSARRRRADRLARGALAAGTGIALLPLVLIVYFLLHKGLGAWSDAEIKRAIAQGISRDGSRLKPPMGFAWYATMTDGDLDAIVAYLRTVPPG